jgi:hypothetical protein
MAAKKIVQQLHTRKKNRRPPRFKLLNSPTVNGQAAQSNQSTCYK